MQPFLIYSDSSSPNAQSRLPDSEFIRFHTQKSIRIATLDRPNSLHALSFSMVNDLLAALRTWGNLDTVRAVVLKGAKIPSGKKSFCAGGDVVRKSLYQIISYIIYFYFLYKIDLFNGKGRVRDQCEFLKREYALNHFISTFPKPIISVLDGFVFGGGAGLSIHGQFRIATENTVFAMPETAIGFWPDIGASFFLPRLEGGLGYYLGLTGTRLKGQDV